MNTQPILEVHDLCVNYGAIRAVKGITLEVREGQLVALIGSNGAGKSSTLSALCGVIPSFSGEVKFAGRTLISAKQSCGAWEIVKMGMVMVPEGRGVFTRMSVLENLKMGAFIRDDKQGIEEDLQLQLTIFPRLKERLSQLAGNLSGGEQQMLALARALMSRPRMVLLDEPSMGLSPIMVDKIFEVIQTISKQGVSVLLVEQNAQRALEIAQIAYVMESGLISYSGEGLELIKDPRIQASYLGEA
jgi:branched-chain amino acid transport system ATP-binding protein